MAEAPEMAKTEQLLRLLLVLCPIGTRERRHEFNPLGWNHFRRLRVRYEKRAGPS